MSFLYPSFLYALAVVAIPLVIHFFNFYRAKKIVFPTIRFLKQTKQEENKGEKSKSPAQEDEDTMDNPGDTKSPGDGEYVEELSEDEKKYIDTNSVYHTDLYRDIENLSVSDLPTKEDMQTCSTCQVQFRDLAKHQKLENCKLYPYPEMRSNRRSRQ